MLYCSGLQLLGWVVVIPGLEHSPEVLEFPHDPFGLV